MTDLERKMMEKMGLTEDDFSPKKITAEERLAAVEAVMLEILLAGEE